MKRYTPTRSVATVVMALGVATLFTMIVMVPFTSVRPTTVGFVALIVGGVSMLLRERVFPRSTGAIAATVTDSTTHARLLASSRG